MSCSSVVAHICVVGVRFPLPGASCLGILTVHRRVVPFFQESSTMQCCEDIDEDLLSSLYGFKHKPCSSLQSAAAVSGFCKIWARFAEELVSKHCPLKSLGVEHTHFQNISRFHTLSKLSHCAPAGKTPKGPALVGAFQRRPASPLTCCALRVLQPQRHLVWGVRMCAAGFEATREALPAGRRGDGTGTGWAGQVVPRCPQVRLQMQMFSLCT